MSLQWKLEKILLKMKFTWRIARSASDQKYNFILHLTDGEKKTRGEIAPNSRYGESLEKIQEEFENFKIKAKFKLKSSDLPLKELEDFLDSLNLCHSLRFGIESAWVHLQCLKKGISVPEYFSIPKPTDIRTSFSLPIMEPGKLEDFIKPLKRFSSLKVKVDANSALETVEILSRLTQQKLRIDGNEAWTDLAAFYEFCGKIRGKNIEFIEQPMPAAMKGEYKEAKRQVPFELIADESIEDKADFSELSTMFHGVNVKLMKAGGYRKSVDLLQGAKAASMKTMLGCMIETSLGISSAFHLAALADYVDLDGCLLIQDEPFKLVDEWNGILQLVDGWTASTS